jgi:hypothetical protein
VPTVRAMLAELYAKLSGEPVAVASAA